MTAARELEALEREWRRSAENCSGTYHDGYNAALHACADELAALRSQLGQGAVAWCQADDPLSSTAFSWPGSDRNPTHTTPLFPHPVQSVAVDEWLPIESAPHETLVLLYSPDGTIEVGMATKGREWDAPDGGVYSNRSAHGTATHWQPLPPPPAALAAARENKDG